MTTTVRILHHLRADLRRQWPLFLLLVIGLCVFTAIDYRLLYRESRGFSSINLISMAVFGLGCLMALFVIHADPPTGTSPFWKTRPLRGLEIFFSKAIQIVLIGLLMFVGWNAAPYFSGAPGAQLWSFQAMIPPLLLGVMAVAAVSRNLFQALIVGGILWAGVGTFAWLSEFTQNHSAFDKTYEMRATGTLLAGIVLATGAIAITLSQYLRNRQVICIVAYSILLIVAFLVMQRSTADLLTNYISPSEQESLGLNETEMGIDPDPKTFQRGSNTLHTPVKTFHFYRFSGKATIDQLPEGVFVSMMSIKGELQNPETGETFSSFSRGNQSRPHSKVANFVSHDYTILNHSSTPPREPVLMAPFLKLPSSQYSSMTEQTWRYEGTANALLARFEPVQTIPFGEESVIRRPGWSAIISSRVEDTKRVEVHLKANLWRGGNHDRTPAFTCLVVNRQRNEAIPSSGSGGGSSANRHRSVDFSWAFNRSFWADGKHIEIADDWLDDAEIILYRENFLGTIQRPVTLDPLTLPDLNPHLSRSSGRSQPARSRSEEG